MEDMANTYGYLPRKVTVKFSISGEKFYYKSAVFLVYSPPVDGPQFFGLWFIAKSIKSPVA
jgi:hypothetical protein